MSFIFIAIVIAESVSVYLSPPPPHFLEYNPSATCVSYLQRSKTVRLKFAGYLNIKLKLSVGNSFYSPASKSSFRDETFCIIVKSVLAEQRLRYTEVQ